MPKRPKIFDELDRIAPLIPTPVYWLDTNYVIVGGNDLCLGAIGSTETSMQEALVGKTYYDYYPKDIADELTKMVRIVLETKQAIKVEEKITDVETGKFRYYETARAPLFNRHGNIVGTICTAIEITSQKEAEQLEIENATNKAQLNAQTEFRKIIGEAAHDLRTPLTSLMAIIAHCDALPEKQRVMMRNATGEIRDVISEILNYYRPQGEVVSPDEGKRTIFLSAILYDLIAERSYQYHKKSPIQFVTEFSEAGEFAFIHAQPLSLARSVTNLLNNAIQSIDEKTRGTVTLKLDADKEWVRITIQDSGKGMDSKMVEMIKGNIAFTEGKQKGHGIGLSQVYDMLARNYGEMDVQSTPGQGSSFVLKFSRYPAPTWCAEQINLTPQDTLIVLDDDPSIHGAWDMRFESILKQVPCLQLYHFEEGEKALKFINELHESQRANLVLLTDYEFLGQSLTGCDVIAESKPKQAILVTSHYAESELRDKIIRLNAKMLPKPLAVMIPINLIASQAETEYENLREVEAVWLEDDQTMVNTLKSLLKDVKIDFYHTPNDLKNNIHLYPKTTRILLDNNFDPSFGDIKGLNIAVELHQQGFTRLFLISGDDFFENTIPNYIKVVSKMDAFNIKSYW